MKILSAVFLSVFLLFFSLPAQAEGEKYKPGDMELSLSLGVLGNNLVVKSNINFFTGPGAGLSFTGAHNPGDYGESFLFFLEFFWIIASGDKFFLKYYTGGGLIYTRPLQEVTGQSSANFAITQSIRAYWKLARDFSFFAETRFNTVFVDKEVLNFPEGLIGVSFLL